jgi:predicted porin
MKYILSAIALAIAGPAFAQSSVTIYGVIDADGEYISGHSKDVRITSGGLNGSRIGFKGTEDIGGGNFVDFVLEGGINLDTGTSGNGTSLFGRQAFGDLRGAFGTVSAGRQYSSTYNVSDQFSVFSNTPVGPTTALIGGYGGGYEPVQGSTITTYAAGTAYQSGSEVNGSPARVNNSFRYTSPVFNGFKVSGLYGAGEVTGQTTKTRLFDGAVIYSGYGLDAQVAFVSDKAVGTSAATTANVNTILFGAKYTIDAFRVVGGFVKGDDKRNIAVKQDGTAFWLGGDYRVGPNLFKLQWVHNKVDNSTTGYAVAAGKTVKNNSYGVGYQYDLSKRTALYTDLTRFQNTGVARFDSAISGISGVTSGTDLSFTQFALGVRHMF